jgi:hypothetical protein
MHVLQFANSKSAHDLFQYILSVLKGYGNIN